MSLWNARLRRATGPVLQPYFEDVGTEIQSLRGQLQDQVRDQLNDHLDWFLSRLQGSVASEVESRLLPRLGSVDDEVASLREGTAETG
ncbi:MAG: hypothetical protein ACLQVK_13395 [Acidimicrobiales bacterium]